jgi:hypothetical protein
MLEPIGTITQGLFEILEWNAAGWLTLTFINAGLAQAKGRSGLAWWFSSLFFGPVCTFLIVVSKPRAISAARSDSSHQVGET